jgi:hypothetical protein
MHFSSPKGVSVPSIAGRVLRGDGLFHRWEHGLERVREAEPVLAWELRVVSVPSIAGRVLRGVELRVNFLVGQLTFQCPPSRAGSCGGRSDICWAIGIDVFQWFQCPPSRAGSCGSRASARRQGGPHVFQCPPSRAGSCGSVLSRSSSACPPFQCPPSRAGSCGRMAASTADVKRQMFQCPPSRAGSCGAVEKAALIIHEKAFQCPPSRAGSCGETSRRSSATWPMFQCPPSRAGSCGWSNIHFEPSAEGRLGVSVPSIAGRVLRGRSPPRRAPPGG